MPQPTPYDRQNSFTLDQQENPSAPLNGADVDAEFNAVKVTIDDILSRLELIQRDDGSLANQSVGPDQVASSFAIGINSPTVWEEATEYSRFDTVFNETTLYKSTEDHTSGDDFSTDMDAGKWEVLAEFNVVAIEDGSVTEAKIATGAVTAAKIGTGAVTANKIGSSAVVADKIGTGAVTTDKLATNSVSTTKIVDEAVTYAKIQTVSAQDRILGRTDGTGAIVEIPCTAAGRALLDDADAATQRATLGLGTAATLDAGTAATLDAGTGVGNLLQFTEAAKLPALDGSLLTNLPGLVVTSAEDLGSDSISGVSVNGNGYTFSASSAPASNSARAVFDSLTIEVQADYPGQVFEFEYQAVITEVSWGVASGYAGATKWVSVALFADSEANARDWVAHNRAPMTEATPDWLAAIPYRAPLVRALFRTAFADISQHTMKIAIVPGHSASNLNSGGLTLARRRLIARKIA